MDLFKLLHVKIISLCVGAVLWSSQCMGAYADDVTIDGLKYTLYEYNHTATVSGFVTGLTDADVLTTVTITHTSSPTDEIIEYTVTAIGRRAFYACKSLTNITIPNSVTAIESEAFYNCKNLKSVTIPNNITEIGDCAFAGCSSLTNITIPYGVTKIGESAFYGCANLTNVTIPNSVKKIGASAFRECSSLKSVTIPGSETTIGDNAFRSCSNLTSVTIFNGVIGESVFRSCSNLMNVTISNGIIGEYAFELCSNLTSVTISNGVTEIGYGAFRECTSLRSITIPNSVTVIEGGTFDGCTSLTNVTLPDCVTEFGGAIFYGCKNLTSVIIPNGATKIGGYAFFECKSLRSVTIPNSVTEIGEYAFECCKSITSVTIPNGVTEIGEYAFANCSNLMSFTIPKSVTKIGNEAFLYCTSLTSVTIPDGITEIAKSTFECCRCLKSVTIPNSVTKIGEDAFYGCISLNKVTCLNPEPPTLGSGVFISVPIKFIFVPSNAISAYKSADKWNKFNFEDTAYKEFAYFEVDAINYLITSLADKTVEVTLGDNKYSGDIVIPETVTYNDTEYSVSEIENYAFWGSNSLRSVTIPNSVTKIGGGAFYKCYSLNKVTSFNLEPPTIQYTAFDYTPVKTIFVPSEAISAYKSAVVWKEYNIEDIANKDFLYIKVDGCYYRVTSIADKTVEVTVGDNEYSGDIVIPEVVTYDGSEYFVTEIGDYTFYECQGLQSIAIPSSVTYIGADAFYQCANLNSIIFTSEVLSSDGTIFDGVIATAYVPAASAPLYGSLYLGDDITIKYLNEYKRSTQAGAFGTLCLPYDYTPEGATLYGIESIEDDKLILTAVEGNHGLANTAYIYQATAPDQNFPYIPGEALNTELEDVTTGALTSPASYSVVPDGSFMLQTQNGVLAFYKVDGETYIMPHRAYLTPDVVGSNRDALSLQLASNEGNQAGLETVRALTQGAPAIYDTNGRRRSTLQKGLNIVGGVKVMVK